MTDVSAGVSDIVVLGGGSAGYACGRRSWGLSVVLVEQDKLGGTCLHRGCIPTKALLHTAEVADSARDSAQFGVSTAVLDIDLAAVHAYKDGVVARLYKGLQGLVASRAITVVQAGAHSHRPCTGRASIDGRALDVAGYPDGCVLS